MDYKHIKAILERYFQGNSSLQEEEQLRQYFQRADVHPELKPYQGLFRFFVAEKQEQTSAEFDQQWSTPPLRTIHKQTARHWVRWVSIAALVVLSLGTWWWSQQGMVEKPQPTATIDWSQYEPASEEEALAVTRNALKSMSFSLKAGATQAADEVTKVKRLSDPLR